MENIESNGKLKMADSIHTDIVRETELDANLGKKAKLELGENDQDRRSKLRQLEERILNDKEIPNARRDDAFLLRFLRAKKFDVDKSFRMIKKYFKMKNDQPDLFRVTPSSDMHELLQNQMQQVLPNREESGSIVYVFRVHSSSWIKRDHCDCLACNKRRDHQLLSTDLNDDSGSMDGSSGRNQIRSDPECTTENVTIVPSTSEIKEKTLEFLTMFQTVESMRDEREKHLTNEHVKARADLRESQKQLKNSEENQTQMEIKMLKLRSSLLQKENELKTLGNEKNDLQSLYNITETCRDYNYEELTQLREELKEIESRYGELAERKSQLQTELDESKKAYELKLTIANEKIRSNEVNFQREKEQLMEANEEFEQKLRNAAEQVKLLEADKSVLKSCLSQKNDEISRLDTDLNEKQSQLIDTARREEQLRTELSLMKNDIKTLNGRLLSIEHAHKAEIERQRQLKNFELKQLQQKLQSEAKANQDRIEQEKATLSRKLQQANKTKMHLFSEMEKFMKNLTSEQQSDVESDEGENSGDLSAKRRRDGEM